MRPGTVRFDRTSGIYQPTPVAAIIYYNFVTHSADSLYYPAQKLVVDADAQGQRIDNYLLGLLKGVPRSHIYRILRKGEVRVNGGRKKPLYKLSAGDLLRVPPVRVEERSTPNVPERVYAQLQQAILHEDEQLLVLNKPSGIAVHGGTGLEFGVIEAMQQHHTTSTRLELVHRIDRETSGCLLLAKNRQTLTALQNIFRAREVEKSYLALLKGKLPSRRLVVDKPLLKREISGESMVVVSAEGKRAHSEFVLQQRLPGASLARVIITTGRTHQIRAHAKSLGHPLAGDDKYGDKAFNQRCRQLGCKRLFLHAAELGFVLDGRRYQFSAPLPEALRALLEAL